MTDPIDEFGPLPELPDETAEPASELVTAGEDRLAAIEQELARLGALFEERLRYDEAKAKALDRLHAELDEHKERLRGEAMRPVFKALIQLYDNVCESVEVLDGAGRQHVEVLRDGLLDVLYRLDVEPIEDRVERFDRSFQAATRTEPASSPEDDWAIAKVVREGFRWQDRVLRPQQVVVRRYAPGEPAAGAEES